MVLQQKVLHLMALVTASAVTGGDAAIGVASTGFVQRAQQRLLGGGAGDLNEIGDRRAATTGGRGLVLADSHSCPLPLRAQA